jgi:hypothetical protein
MRRYQLLTILFLLLFLMGSLFLTASNYADCHNADLDEFLDLAIAWQNPNVPVLDHRWNSNHFEGPTLKTFYCNRVDPLTNFLRC